MKLDRKVTVLLVDSDIYYSESMKKRLEQEACWSVTAANVKSAFNMIVKFSPDLILLEASQVNDDGISMCTLLKNDEQTKAIPIIVLTNEQNKALRIDMLTEGAEEIVDKSIEFQELWLRVQNLIIFKQNYDKQKDVTNKLEQQIHQNIEAIKFSHMETVRCLIQAGSYKDDISGNHNKRISYYCWEIANSIGMANEFLKNIFHSSPLHDIGKIGIPDYVLLKAGRHTEEETKVMQTHTLIGAKILGEGKKASSHLAMAAQIALGHHEHWDGSGYPKGVIGDKCPLAARIMAICDVYDGLRSRRPYKMEMDHEAATQIILHGDGRTLPSHFDPQILEHFQKNAKRFNDIFHQYYDEATP